MLDRATVALWVIFPGVVVEVEHVEDRQAGKPDQDGKQLENEDDEPSVFSVGLGNGLLSYVHHIPVVYPKEEIDGKRLDED